METSVLKQFAREVAQQTVIDHWWLWLILILVAGLVAYFGSLLGGYAARRGENLATKADFDDLLEQTTTTAEEVAQIHSRVALTEWTEKEARSLRRQKLEELLLGAFEAKAWLTAEENRLLFPSDVPNPDPLPSPMEKVEAIGVLYFPELWLEVKALDVAHGSYLQWTRETLALALNAEMQARAAGHPQPQGARFPVINDRHDELLRHWKSVVETLGNLKVAASALMAQITAVSRDG